MNPTDRSTDYQIGPQSGDTILVLKFFLALNVVRRFPKLFALAGEAF